MICSIIHDIRSDTGSVHVVNIYRLISLFTPSAYVWNLNRCSSRNDCLSIDWVVGFCLSSLSSDLSTVAADYKLTKRKLIIRGHFLPSETQARKSSADCRKLKDVTVGNDITKLDWFWRWIFSFNMHSHRAHFFHHSAPFSRFYHIFHIDFKFVITFVECFRRYLQYSQSILIFIPFLIKKKDEE